MPEQSGPSLKKSTFAQFNSVHFCSARHIGDFAWQAGYGVFSVSPSNLEVVEAYIADQETHHRKLSSQDEFRAMLRKHRIDWDERYVWE